MVYIVAGTKVKITVLLNGGTKVVGIFGAPNPVSTFSGQWLSN